MKGLQQIFHVVIRSNLFAGPFLAFVVLVHLLIVSLLFFQSTTFRWPCRMDRHPRQIAGIQDPFVNQRRRSASPSETSPSPMPVLIPTLISHPPFLSRLQPKGFSATMCLQITTFQTTWRLLRTIRIPVISDPDFPRSRVYLLYADEVGWQADNDRISWIKNLSFGLGVV